MRDRVKKKLEEARGPLVKEMQPLPVFGLLFQNGILTSDQLDDILPHKERLQLNEKVLDELPTKGDEAFNVFTFALNEHHQPQLKELLEKDDGVGSPHADKEYDPSYPTSPEPITKLIGTIPLAKNKMNPVLQDRLEQRRERIVSEMQPLTLFGLFHQNKVFDLDDMDRLLPPGEREKVNERLLDILPERDDQGYDILKFALEESDQDHLLKYMDGKKTQPTGTGTGTGPRPDVLRDSDGRQTNGYMTFPKSADEAHSGKEPGFPSQDPGFPVEAPRHADEAHSARLPEFSSERPRHLGPGPLETPRYADEAHSAPPPGFSEGSSPFSRPEKQSYKGSPRSSDNSTDPSLNREGLSASTGEIPRKRTFTEKVKDYMDEKFGGKKKDWQGSSSSISDQDLPTQPKFAGSEPDLRMRKPKKGHVSFEPLDVDGVEESRWKSGQPTIDKPKWTKPSVDLKAPNWSFRKSKGDADVNAEVESPDYEGPEVDKPSRWSIKKPNWKAPEFNLKKPSFEGPDIKKPSLDLEAPNWGSKGDVDVESPNYEGPEVDKPSRWSIKKPNWKAPEFNLKKPSFEGPDIKKPSLDLQAPSWGSKGDADVESPDYEGPEVDKPSRWSLKKPSFKSPNLNVKKPNLEMPDVNMSRPHLSAPDISFQKPRFEGNGPELKSPPKWGFKRPDWSFRKSSNDLDSPNDNDVSIEGGDVNMSAPNVQLQRSDEVHADPRVKAKMPFVDSGHEPGTSSDSDDDDIDRRKRSSFLDRFFRKSREDLSAPDKTTGKPTKTSDKQTVTPEMEKEMKEAAARIAKNERMLKLLHDMTDKALYHAVKKENLEDKGQKDLAKLIRTPGKEPRNDEGVVLLDKMTEELQYLQKQRTSDQVQAPAWYANVNTAMHDTYNTLMLQTISTRSALAELESTLKMYRRDKHLRRYVDKELK
ncbi:PREDICTED: neuroblast differentiation-associated protein AHNAK-like isoform X1 [Branchiostoma belcheri]|uniref:Neuroblast differentiation-associated protein AHNAK-like isoform X1 n=1 Tax=Branchiostoma belcheri TaxID=7741 RepID=A0A6P4YZ82_BRABE|nr:PREDICTED: neuroblast differentiation-associated protein AHNAK-like isoform X1 [Branchiostoma belcheri]